MARKMESQVPGTGVATTVACHSGSRLKIALIGSAIARVLPTRGRSPRLT